MAKKVGITHGWLAFIPIANAWLMGEVADLTPEGKIKNSKFRVWLLVFCLATNFFSVIVGVTALIRIAAMLGTGVSGPQVLASIVTSIVIYIFLYFAVEIAYIVFYYIAFYRICQTFDPKNGTVWFAVSLVSLFFGFNGLADAIAFFVLGRKQIVPPDMRYPADCPPPPPPYGAPYAPMPGEEYTPCFSPPPEGGNPPPPPQGNDPNP